MRRAIALAIVFCCFCLTLCACGDESEQTSVLVVSSEEATATGSAVEYSTDVNSLHGYWQPVYYSYDNENYHDYLEEFGSDSIFIFYPNDKCVLTNGGEEQYYFTYIIPEDAPGTINFYDSETGKAMDFIAGFGIVPIDEEDDGLILSIYDLEDSKIIYIMLKRVYNTEI